MKVEVAFMILALSLAGCGKKIAPSTEDKAMARASYQLDNHEFEKAITTLESLRKTNPNDELIKSKLLHAYAGAGSFEAIKVVSIWKDIESLLKQFKKANEKEVKASAQAELENFVTKIEKILEPIPNLTEKQKIRLEQAISLYHELGYTVESAGEYNNFKWGTLHIYRLAVNLKEIVKDTKDVQIDSDHLDLKPYERTILPKLKVMGQDIFMAYKLFGNSFDKIRKISDGIDKIIAKTVNDKDFKLKVNTLAKNEIEFYRSLIKDNIQAASILIRKTTDIYVESRHPERLNNLVKESLPSERDLRASERRIEALIRIVITNFSEENPEVESKLKNIFNERLKNDFIAAAKESIEVKNTNPLKELLATKKPEIEMLNSYYLLMKGEIAESDLEENIRVELENLKSKIDLEHIKEELKAIARSLKEETKVVRLEGESITYKNKDEIIKRQKSLKKQLKEIEKYLNDVSEDLDQGLESENPDKEEMERITEETKEFVES